MIAQAFHWLIAALVLVQLGLGIYVSDLPLSLARLQWLSRHKALGVLLLALVLLRLAWRVFNRPPSLPVAMPRVERVAARVNHWLLYVLLLAAPLAGWLHASAAGLGVNFFGAFTLPDLVAPDPRRAEWFHQLHGWLVAGLAALVAVHVAAALRHAFILRDGLFQRMVPAALTRKKNA